MEQSPMRVGRGDRDPLGLRRSLLRDAVFLRLLDNVLRGEYRRGQRLRLDTIAEDMRVSRTPVREALVALESHQLVTVQRYVGVVITHWSAGQMTERLRIARALVVDPPVSGAGRDDRFDPAWLRECRTEAGAFVELAAWFLRRRGAPVSADWMLSQRTVLDTFFTDDVALANGIDAVVDRARRLDLVDQAVQAAERDAVDDCAVVLLELAAALIALPDRFRVAVAS
ncbi:GntR family transcriptional regulator [Curtobacterium flaccumfaciens pv. oortii]|uniref:GntR family transcriptional regulator n=1 Tax=Curtobacterium flaccumfaciens TaxID=2035 RepID=UPI001BDE90C2|nr:GntR family transcriptional regulator [Curtobacterium flaccumfaciens]MBT1624079.1 GntR family transcriptional regulator [Curtobacterium flaccumfaciens pv. oortii]